MYAFPFVSLKRKRIVTCASAAAAPAVAGPVLTDRAAAESPCSDAVEVIRTWQAYSRGTPAPPKCSSSAAVNQGDTDSGWAAIS